MTPLHEGALKIAISLMYIPCKDVEEMQSKIEWLRNLSHYGVDIYLRESERRNYIKYTGSGYKANKNIVNKAQDKYFN